MDMLLGLAIGWVAGSGLVWIWFTATGLIRDEGEWRAYKERIGKK